MIPRNAGFCDAVSGGDLIPFFLRLYRGEGKKEDRVFWEQITEAYRLLSNVMERKEEKVYYA